MFIESYALQTVWLIAQLISYAISLKGNLAYLLFSRSSDQVKVRYYKCHVSTASGHNIAVLDYLIPSDELSSVIKTCVEFGDRAAT
jgi:hypothetical protein